MSLLDANADSLTAAAVGSFRPAPPPIGHGAPRAEPGAFDNFAGGAGRYFMRSMAETGRAIDILGAVGPVAVDAVTGGTERQEAYFREHDEVFGRAVDYWTPKPGDVGAAGQVAGSFAGGMVQFLANPALMVGTAQLGTAEDLVKQGVRSDAAVLAGDVAALSALAGIAVPIFGKTLGQRLAAGAAGNLATNVPEAAVKREIVRAADAPPGVADQFDPWDMRARAVDVLLGAVFGAKAHFDARPAQTQVDAVTLLNAARHIEEASGRPANDADIARAVDSTRQAIEQMSAGQPVAVPRVEGLRQVNPIGDDVAAVVRAAAEEIGAGEPLALPRMTTEPPAAVDKLAEAQGDKAPDSQGQQAAAALPVFDESVRLPAGDFDAATGAPRTVSANEMIARMADDATRVRATAAGLMETAAACLLGGV